MEWIAVAAVCSAVALGAFVLRRRIVRLDTLAAASARPVSEADVEAFLRPYRERLDRLRRPVARIGLEPLEDDDPVASKVGGAAWWPEAEPDPIDSQGKPLVLLAQCNLAHLPADLGLPRAGLLQFFLRNSTIWECSWDGGGFLVKFWPDSSVASRCLPAQAVKRMPHDPQRPLAMRFSPGEEMPAFCDPRMVRVMDDDVDAAIGAHAQAHGLDAGELLDACVERFSTEGHKFGGHPHHTQDFVMADKSDSLLLFQLDSDDYVMWADAGVGNFFIDADDLARADFGDVFFTWDCH